MNQCRTQREERKPNRLGGSGDWKRRVDQGARLIGGGQIRRDGRSFWRLTRPNGRRSFAAVVFGGWGNQQHRWRARFVGFVAWKKGRMEAARLPSSRPAVECEGEGRFEGVLGGIAGSSCEDEGGVRWVCFDGG